MNQSEEEILFKDVENILNIAFKAGAFNLHTASSVVDVFNRTAASLQELVYFKQATPESKDIQDTENEIEVPGTSDKVLKKK